MPLWTHFQFVDETMLHPSELRVIGQTPWPVADSCALMSYRSEGSEPIVIHMFVYVRGYGPPILNTLSASIRAPI